MVTFWVVLLMFALIVMDREDQVRTEMFQFLLVAGFLIDLIIQVMKVAWWMIGVLR